jgi:hypothetical protein
MFDGFFQAAAFLQNLIAQAVPAKEPLGILLDHLTECADIHCGPSF